MKKTICIIATLMSILLGTVYASRGVELGAHLPPPSAELFDSFDSSLDEWEIAIENGSNWQIVESENEKYLTSGAVDTWGDDKETLIISTKEIMSDRYSVSVSVSDERYGAMASLVFKYTSPKHFYSLRMLNIDNVDYIGFYRRNDVTLWQEENLTLAEFPGGTRIPNKEYEIKVEVCDNRFYGYVDDELVTEYVEDKPYFDGNKAGMFQSYGNPMYDNFAVYYFDKAEDEEFLYNRDLLFTLGFLWDGGENGRAEDFVTHTQLIQFYDRIIPCQVYDDDKYLTYEEALDSFLSYLMYDKAENSSAYYSAGERLLEGVSSKVGNITFSDFVKMAVNAFEIDVIKKDYGSSGGYYVSKGETLLEAYCQISSDTAILYDNGVTSLDGRTKLKSGHISFDNGVKMKTDDADITEYLGYNIRYYCYYDGDEPILLWYRIEDTDDAFIYSDEIVSYINGTLTYLKRGEDKTKKVKIPASAAIIYNGKYVNNLQDYMLVMDSGDVTLIDNDGSNGVDVVSVMNYEDVVVERIDCENEKVFDLYSNNGFSWKDAQFVNFRKDNYRIASAEDVLRGNVLSVACSADGDVYTFLVSRTKLSGKVERIDNESDVVYIDGEKVPLSSDFYNNSYISPGDIGTMYLNSDGVGVYFTHDEESFFTVAYMIDCKESEYGLDHRVKVQLFDGEIKVIPCAETMKIDDRIYRRNSSFSALDGYVDIFEYKLNSNGEISYIRFPREDSADSNSKNLAHMGGYVGGTYYKSDTRSFSGFLLADNDVKVFLVPLDRSRTEEYRIADISYFKNDVMYYSLSGYSRCGNNETAEFIVSEFDTYPQYQLGSACIVERISDVLKDNGDSSKMITVRYDGTDAHSVILADYCELGEVAAGDIIQYSVNSDGEVHGIVPVFDNSSETLYHYGDTYYTASYRMVYGTVGELKKNSFIFNRTGGGSEIVTLGCPIVIFDDSSRSVSVSTGSRDDIRDYENYGTDADKMLIRFEYGVPREMIIYR